MDWGVCTAYFGTKQVVGELVVETIARIRREHFIKGKTIKEIARDLKVSRNTVRKVLRSGETSFEYERHRSRRPAWCASTTTSTRSRPAPSGARSRSRLMPIAS